MSEARMIEDRAHSIILNDDQQDAEDAILAAFNRGEREFLLIGAAGVGKTTLMQSVCRKLSAIKRKKEFFEYETRVKAVVTAPTHKAVDVISKKMDEGGLSKIARMTIHALLGLKPTVSDTEKQVLKRNPYSQISAAFYDVVVIDEASMLGSDLQHYINSDLQDQFVLYIADQAQLPPVGEDLAPCFKKVPKKNTFRLTKIVRQAEGNPILHAANILRLQQDTGRMDWSWVGEAYNPDTHQGIYHCGRDADNWLKEAFTSEEFAKDNDAYRYIAYTNQQVRLINRKIRKWIYGETPTPFVAGERVVCRNPILNDDDKPIFNTNEEAIVVSIEETVKTYRFTNLLRASGQVSFPSWEVELPVWEVCLKKVDCDYDDDDSIVCVAFMPKDDFATKKIEHRLYDEAKKNRNRWKEYYAFKQRLADLRPVYAMTGHNSQGSTFGVAFVDVPDMANRARVNILECQKLMYVAVTRASKAVVLVGV